MTQQHAELATIPGRIVTFGPASLTLRVIIKDYLVLGRYLWMAAPFFVFYAAAFFCRPALLLAGAFICSLPVSRAGLVAGRYLGSALVLAVTHLVAALYGGLLSRLLPGQDEWFDLGRR